MKRATTSAIIAISVLAVVILWHASPSFGQDTRLEFRSPHGESVSLHDYPSSQDSSLTQLGYWLWGRCDGVAAMGDYLLIGSGAALVCIDISDMHNPVTMWDTVFGGHIDQLTIQDSLAFALLGTSFVIMDFRDPLLPRVLSTLEMTFPLTFVVSGSLVFVKQFLGPIHCLDISDPSSPYVRSTIPIFSMWNRLAATNHHLYVSNPTGLDSYYCDVSNPDSIVITELWESLALVSLIYARDTLLMTASGASLWIYSISTPHAPAFLSWISPPNFQSGIGLTQRGALIYYGDAEEGVVVVDITDPRQPVILGTFDSPIRGVRANHLAASDHGLHHAYAHGVANLSISDLPTITMSSFFTTGHDNRKVIVRDSLAYVTSGYAGLWTVDLSDVNRPRRIGHLPTSGYAYDIVVDGMIAYLSVYGEGWNGVLTIDISQPDSMRVLDSIALNAPSALSKSGNHVFVTHAVSPGIDTSLTVLSVENPLNIELLSSIVGDFRAAEIVSKDSLVFVASDSGMKIYDWSNPVNPTLRSTVLTHTRGVSVDGQLAYIHGKDSTFVVNVEDPDAPVILGRVRHPPPYFGSAPWESIVDGSRVIWASPSKFGIIDVSNPADPRILIEDSQTVRGGGGVYHVNDTLFLTTSAGLWIGRYSGITSVGSQPTRKPTAFRLAQNFPNPFNPTTRIRFSVPHRGSVSLEVFNPLGQKVRQVFDGMLEPGEHEIEFDGEGLPSGLYFYKLISDRSSLVGKMILIR